MKYYNNFLLKLSYVPSDVLNLSPSVKDKAEILLQVEELLHIKEELSSQVCKTERTKALLNSHQFVCI